MCHTTLLLMTCHNPGICGVKRLNGACRTLNEARHSSLLLAACCYQLVVDDIYRLAAC